MMIPDRSSEKVTIEDLLRLKRAERPSPEFWSRFEQDLRAKQLAAIVEKRPWWQALRLPQTARAIARFQVPAGAAAILALSLVVANQYHGRSTSPAVIEVPEILNPAPHVALVTPRLERQAAVIAAVPASPAPQAIIVEKPAGLTAAVQTEVAVNDSSRAAQPMDLTAMIPWGLSQADEETSATQPPVSTRLLQTGLEVSSTSDAGVTSLLGNALADGAPLEAHRSQAADIRPAVVASTSPRELRRAKVLAGLVLANNSDNSDYARAVHSRDAEPNDISEDQLYDSARRLGVGGDRFTVKF